MTKDNLETIKALIEFIRGYRHAYTGDGSPLSDESIAHNRELDGYETALKDLVERYEKMEREIVSLINEIASYQAVIENIPRMVEDTKQALGKDE